MTDPLWNGEWMHIHSDPYSGAQTYIKDNGDGTSTIKKITPVEQILDSAAADRSANAGRKWGDGQIIGTIPDTIFYTTGYAEAKKNNDDKWLRRFWNNSDYQKLRTFEGKL